MKHLKHCGMVISCCILLSACMAKRETNGLQFLRQCIAVYVSDGYSDISQPKSLVLKSYGLETLSEGVYEMGMINTGSAANSSSYIAGTWIIVGDTLTLYPKAVIESRNMSYNIKSLDFSEPNVCNSTRQFVLSGDKLKDITRYSRMDSADMADYGMVFNMRIAPENFIKIQSLE